MNIRKVSPSFFVAEQIAVSDISAAAAQGIKTVICNRPNHESPDQAETADIESAAAADGIAFLHIPVIAGSITDANIDDFEAAFRKVQGPVLAYCRSGARSIALWALMEAKSVGADAILATVRDAGYDLTPTRSRLLERAAVEGES